MAAITLEAKIRIDIAERISDIRSDKLLLGYFTLEWLCSPEKDQGFG